MSTKTKRVAPDRALALEIADSCALGDHTVLSRPTMRGIVGLGSLFVGAVINSFTGSRTDAPVEAATLLIAANPVAHGARLVDAVRQSLGGAVKVVADQRFAACEVERAFPGVSMVSLSRESRWNALSYAFTARRMLPGGASIPGTRSRLYGEYLFVAQAMRYALAHSAVADLAREILIVTDFDRHTYARPWVWAANQRGLATATLVHGSPNTQNYLPFFAGHVFVWGQVQADWVMRHSSQTEALTVGRPDLSDESIVRDGPARVILCHSKESLSDSESEKLRALLAEQKDQGCELVLRLHPSASVSDLDERWARIAERCDRVVIGSESLTESLRIHDVVVSIASSSVIDAIAMGVQGIVISDLDRALPADLEAVRAGSETLLVEILAGRGMAAAQSLAQRLVAARGSDAAALLREAVSAVRELGAR